MSTPRGFHIAYRSFTKGARLLPQDHAFRLSQALKAHLGRVGAKRGSELSVVFVGLLRMRRLSRRFHPAGVAEILAFPMDSPMLGELVFCPELIARQASLWGRKPSEHMRHLFVHGLLHLYGHDHQSAQSARRMEQLEKKICG